MKSLFFTFLFSLSLSLPLLSQVAVNTDGTAPDNSAMLDVKSTSKGLLAPRMTNAQKMGISSPAFGLMIFQTDGAAGLYVNLGSPAFPVWTMVGTNAPPWLFNGDDIYYTEGNVGINIPNPASKLQVNYDVYGSSNIGFSQYIQDHIIHMESDVVTDGQTGIYALRNRVSANPGTGYSFGSSNSAINGYSFWGDAYSFGTTGYNYNDNNRCGGVLGAQEQGSYWGSLAYKSSGGTGYGGYFSSYSSGSGKSSQAFTGIGIGAYGDLMGADIHGTVYGTYTRGDNYALYADGDLYRNGLDIHLQDNGREQLTVLYTSVSPSVSIQTSGFATLSAGKAEISFDPAFAEAVSANEAVVVTVTPTGNSNGVYLAEITSRGCVVMENNGGKSTVSISYIAIGKRKGYEETSLPEELSSKSYTRDLSRGLNNDADRQHDGEGLYYENSKLKTGRHSSTLAPENKKPLEEYYPKAGK